METRKCLECEKDYEVEVPKFCSRDCFHKNYGKNHTKEKHYKWKGDEVGYHGVHTWLRKNYGADGECEECKKSGRLHWAKLKGKEYERKRENFRHLCSSCHKKYDMNL